MPAEWLVLDTEQLITSFGGFLNVSDCVTGCCESHAWCLTCTGFHGSTLFYASDIPTSTNTMLCGGESNFSRPVS
jgi:hypothetical protein